MYVLLGQKRPENHNHSSYAGRSWSSKKANRRRKQGSYAYASQIPRSLCHPSIVLLGSSTVCVPSLPALLCCSVNSVRTGSTPLVQLGLAWAIPGLLQHGGSGKQNSCVLYARGPAGRAWRQSWLYWWLCRNFLSGCLREKPSNA